MKKLYIFFCIFYSLIRSKGKTGFYYRLFLFEQVGEEGISPISTFGDVAGDGHTGFRSQRSHRG